MIATTFMAVPFLLLAGSPHWVDPAEDTITDAPPPALDLIALEVTIQPPELVIRMQFDQLSTSESDLADLSGFIDFDVDTNATTGRVSHLEEFGLEPCPDIGVDYYVTLYPQANLAELTYVSNYVEQSVGFFETTQQGLSVSATFPLCTQAPDDGICIAEPFQVAALLGNSQGFTDRIPNGMIPLALRLGDFDQDGDVDDADVNHFRSCQSGAGIPYASGCGDADLDHDNDVDMDDFGILQRSYTGS